MDELNKEDLTRALYDTREAQKERDEVRHERDMLLQEKLSTAIELERWRTAVCLYPNDSLIHLLNLGNYLLQ